jgi:hypothetical protein
MERDPLKNLEINEGISKLFYINRADEESDSCG